LCRYAAVAGYVAVARDYGMSPSELALAFVRSRWGAVQVEVS
jgi:aryl-alcohol dehydrogenase-like predicted oxidoreductase